MVKLYNQSDNQYAVKYYTKTVFHLLISFLEIEVEIKVT